MEPRLDGTQEQQFYVLEVLQTAARSIESIVDSMPVYRRRIEKYKDSDRVRAAEIYNALAKERRNLVSAIGNARYALMELGEDKKSDYARMLGSQLHAFSLMTPDYSKLVATLKDFAADLPTPQTTNAAIIGHLMNNVKMGHYPTDLENLGHILRGISFPEGVTTNLLDPCCGDGTALRKLATGNNCFTYGVELDESRAMEAQERLHRVGFGSFFYTEISREAFHLIFLSMFNPLYFIERLGDKGRDLLMRYLPNVSHEAVMELLDEGTRALLEGEDITSAKNYLKTLREEMREVQDTIIRTEGQRDLLSEQSGVRSAQMAGLRETLGVVAEGITALESKRFDGIDTDAKRTRLDDVYTALDDLRGQSLLIPDPSSFDGILASKAEALATRRSQIYRSKYIQVISDVHTSINTLKKEYTRTEAALKNLKPDVQCQTCRQPITAENIDAVRDGLKTALSDIVERGRAENAKLTEVDELEQKDRAVFEQFQKDDIAKLEAEIGELKEARAAALDELRAEVQTLEYDLKFGNLTEDEMEQLCVLQAEKERLATELKPLTDAGNQPEREKEAVLDSLRAEIKGMELRMKAAALYMSKKMGLLFSDFAMNRVAISLFNVVKKTGEAKDAFDFTYEGRPYQWLSLSEKIKAGMEVSALIGRLTDCSYPIFVDNAESVSAIDNVKPRGQVFFARVQKCELTVNVLNAPAQSKEAQAA